MRASRPAALLCAAALAALAACGVQAQPVATPPSTSTPTTGSTGASPTTRPRTTAAPTTAPSADVTVTSGRFSITVPKGFSIEEKDGVYLLRDGDRWMSYSQTATAALPVQYGDALVEQLGGDLADRSADDGWYRAALDRDGARDLVYVRQEGDGVLAVATGHAPSAGDLDAATVEAAAKSARGGVVLSPPAAKASTIELKQFQAPDGGATGLVPADPGWSINSSNGSIEGSSDVGNFIFGLSTTVILPENNPGGDYGQPVSSFVSAADAIPAVLPQLNRNMSDVTVTGTVATDVIPSYTSSGMYTFEYTMGGQRWKTVAIVATDDPAKYSNFVWGFYYTAIGVPVGSDGSVGSGLLKAWQAWDPSGAIAQRNAQAKQLLDESNQVWQETSEFRASTADRQSRDVGCLLQGYSVIEDNSRKYDLPPAPCGQAYGPGGG